MDSDEDNLPYEEYDEISNKNPKEGRAQTRESSFRFHRERRRLILLERDVERYGLVVRSWKDRPHQGPLMVNGGRRLPPWIGRTAKLANWVFQSSPIPGWVSKLPLIEPAPLTARERERANQLLSRHPRYKGGRFAGGMATHGQRRARNRNRLATHTVQSTVDLSFFSE
jgi:hypothetical protein